MLFIIMQIWQHYNSRHCGKAREHDYRSYLINALSIVNRYIYPTFASVNNSVHTSPLHWTQIAIIIATPTCTMIIKFSMYKIPFQSQFNKNSFFGEIIGTVTAAPVRKPSEIYWSKKGLILIRLLNNDVDVQQYTC